MFVFNLIYQHLSCRVGHSYRDFIFLCTHVRSSFCMHSSGTDLKIHVSVPQVSLYLWYVYTRFIKDIYLSKTYIYLSKYKQHWNFTYVCQCSEKHSTLSKPKVATCLRRTARAGPGSAVLHMFVMFVFQSINFQSNCYCYYFFFAFLWSVTVMVIWLDP